MTARIHLQGRLFSYFGKINRMSHLGIKSKQRPYSELVIFNQGDSELLNIFVLQLNSKCLFCNLKNYISAHCISLDKCLLSSKSEFRLYCAYKVSLIYLEICVYPCSEAKSGDCVEEE